MSAGRCGDRGDAECGDRAKQREPTPPENGPGPLRIDVIVHVEMSMLNEGVALQSTWDRTHYDVPSTRLILGKEG
jgi:hypothetical protein